MRTNYACKLEEIEMTHCIKTVANKKIALTKSDFTMKMLIKSKLIQVLSWKKKWETGHCYSDCALHNVLNEPVIIIVDIGTVSKTHFSLRKCKLNATNAMDNMMPIRDSVDTIENAIGEMVATRNLKIRFAIGTWPFFHLMGTHFKQSKSKCNCDGWNNATDCSRPSCTWLNTEMPTRSAPLNETGPFTKSNSIAKKKEWK